MEDYMPALAKFEQRFATERACRAYLAQLRWPTGFCCPQCTTSGSWTTTRCLLMCRRCGYQASVTAGTIFHRTRLPLQALFQAIWLLTDQKHKLSALGLQRLLGLGSYRTASDVQLAPVPIGISSISMRWIIEFLLRRLKRSTLLLPAQYLRLPSLILKGKITILIYIDRRCYGCPHHSLKTTGFSRPKHRTDAETACRTRSVLRQGEADT
ncbi:MAG: transposase [Nitrospira sp.]|nr:MAG: transposase [Nitrospira sp.]